MRGRFRVHRASLGLIHCIAHCSECNWTAEDFRTASARGTVHAKTFGHAVVVEKGFSDHITPVERKTTKTIDSDKSEKHTATVSSGDTTHA